MVLSQGHDGFPKRSQAKMFKESGMQTYTHLASYTHAELSSSDGKR